MKTKTTKELEYKIFEATNKLGIFGCFEVTIGWYGKERVDYLTYDTKGIWRCYEIKISKSDFYSKAHNTFIGHYNYYVLPKKLYNEIKNDIPDHIGVYIEDVCVKKAKRQELSVDEQILKNSMIRSLNREVKKQIDSRNKTLIEKLRRKIKVLEKENKMYQIKYWNLLKKIKGC